MGGYLEDREPRHLQQGTRARRNPGIGLPVPQPEQRQQPGGALNFRSAANSDRRRAPSLSRDRRNPEDQGYGQVSELVVDGGGHRVDGLQRREGPVAGRRRSARRGGS